LTTLDSQVMNVPPLPSPPSNAIVVNAPPQIGSPVTPVCGTWRALRTLVTQAGTPPAGELSTPSVPHIGQPAMSDSWGWEQLGAEARLLAVSNWCAGHAPVPL
jgi:hypothetical protein